MARYVVVFHIDIIVLISRFQIPLESTTLDAAKSSIVYAVTKGVSTAGRAVRLHMHRFSSAKSDPYYSQAIASFTNQAIKGVSQNYNVEMLEKYQGITKDQVITALKKHVLPVFDPRTSVAVVVTTPTKADSIAEGLKSAGFEVEQRNLEIDPEELEEGSESGSECGSSCDSHDGR